VLDPIFSLRRRVAIAPNQRYQFCLVTVVADSREALIGLIERYSEFRTCSARLRDGVDTFAARDAPTPNPSRRRAAFPATRCTHPLPAGTTAAAACQARARHCGQRSLWAQGISGDLPIVLVTIGHDRDIASFGRF
jgi:cellobiose phosphorylase